MNRRAYPADLSHAEWRVTVPLIPPDKSDGRFRVVDMREIVNGIFYVSRSGCAWRLTKDHETLPKSSELMIRIAMIRLLLRHLAAE